MIKESLEYEQAIAASTLFAENRLIDEIKSELLSARLYNSALRNLDTYGPTKKLVEESIVKNRDTDRTRYLKTALAGLNLLTTARYHTSYSDHRALPELLQYHLSWNLVVDSLARAGANEGEMATAFRNFTDSITSVVSSNGIYVVNWKDPPRQASTLYDKVNLEIGRLCAGELVGIYTVKVKGRGRVPHHSHTFLEEHHLLPEPIDGVHEVGGKATRCVQSDIVYIGHGEVHAFRNDEDRDRAFVFVCGSRETGPWDFVQDITSYPSMDFPREKDFKDCVRSIGGSELGSPLDLVGATEYGDKWNKKRLSPAGMPLTHDVVLIDSEYETSDPRNDLQVLVADGAGRVSIAGKSVELKKGDAFVVKSGMTAEIANTSNLILYEFRLD